MRTGTPEGTCVKRTGCLTRDETQYNRLRTPAASRARTYPNTQLPVKLDSNCSSEPPRWSRKSSNTSPHNTSATVLATQFSHTRFMVASTLPSVPRESTRKLAVPCGFVHLLTRRTPATGYRPGFDESDFYPWKMSDAAGAR